MLAISFFMKQKFVFKEFMATFWLGLQRSVVWTVLFFAFQEDNPTIAIAILSTSSIFAIAVYSRFENENYYIIKRASNTTLTEATIGYLF